MFDHLLIASLILVVFVVGILLWLPSWCRSERMGVYCGIVIIIIGLIGSLLAPYYNKFGTLEPGHGLDFNLTAGDTFLMNAFLILAAIGTGYVATSVLPSTRNSVIGKLDSGSTVKVQSVEIVGKLVVSGIIINSDT